MSGFYNDIVIRNTMEYNWKKIKEQILACSKVAFKECNILASDQELEEDVVILNNFIHLNAPYIEIANLRHDMTRSLQETCVSKIGVVESLKMLCTNIDTFLKKLLPFIGIKKFADIKDDGEMKLLKATGLWGSPIPDFKIDVPSSFANNPNGLLILGNANLTRNTLVHTSPAWDMPEVTQRLRYVLALFVLFIHRFKTQLKSTDPSLAKQDSNHFEDNEDFALLYDYISYGNSTMEIKRRYVSMFVRHQLYRFGDMSENDLVNKMIRFSDTTLDANASKRLLGEMEKDGYIVPVKHYPKVYALSEEETERMKEAKENYNTAIQNNNTAIQDVIDRYGIQFSVDQLNEAIMDHLEAQYNYDIEEAIGDAGAAEKEDYKKLVEKLKQVGCPEEKCKDAYEELLGINRDNDIIVRISAGKAFRKISDPGLFNEYVRKADRNVWIDTQILLYLLCHNDDYSTYKNSYFKTAIALFRQHPGTGNFHYKLPLFYLNEIIYQIRQALLLISVVDQPFAKGKKLSQNVFYRHYCYLNSNDGLPEGVESFADYMEDNFNLFEIDAFDKDCNAIIENIVRERLAEYKINVEFIDAFAPNEIERSEELLKEAAKSEGLVKQGKPLHNDAFMGCSLFKNTDEQKPIFITLDGSFEPYRKMYVKRYIRSGSFNWHLFSPSGFVNHLDFIDFRVNPDNLTDDLISMVETSEMKDKTLNFIDRFNRFLDIPQISSNQRKKYIAWVGDLFQSKEFSYKADTSAEEASPQIMRFMEAQDSVFNRFYEQEGGEKVKEFQLMLRNEDWFYKYIQLLSEFSQTFEATKEDLYIAVEGKLVEFKESIKEE